MLLTDRYDDISVTHNLQNLLCRYLHNYDLRVLILLHKIFLLTHLLMYSTTFDNKTNFFEP